MHARAVLPSSKPLLGGADQTTGTDLPVSLSLSLSREGDHNTTVNASHGSRTHTTPLARLARASPYGRPWRMRTTGFRYVCGCEAGTAGGRPLPGRFRCVHMFLLLVACPPTSPVVCEENAALMACWPAAGPRGYGYMSTSHSWPVWFIVRLLTRMRLSSGAHPACLAPTYYVRLMQVDNNNPAVMALLEFLRAHEHDDVLDAAAMARLNDELVPAALQAWPALQDVLESKVNGFREVYPWTADHGFTKALTRAQVFALTQQLMLQVGPPVSLFIPPILFSSSSSSSSSFFFLLQFLLRLYLRVLLTRGSICVIIPSFFCAPFMKLIFLPMHSFFSCVLVYSSF